MNRIHDIYRDTAERVKDFKEVERQLTVEEIVAQSKRCHDCGIPFCHGAGCPLGNVIPEFNAAYSKGDAKLAWDILKETSFFPEFTSRVCPALCEGSCVCGLDEEPVMVRQCEKKIVETAFENKWVKPVYPKHFTGKSVAVIGSGPAGLYAAEKLNRMGYAVTVYEANHKPGGLLRYGIPDFKLDKSVIDRRIEIMERSGISFVCDTAIGKDISVNYLKKHYDFLVLAVGTSAARDLKIPGRELEGIHFALEFLQGQNRVVGGELDEVPVSAKGKKVLVIGGGDTGSDCVGTSIRQGAASVTQIEIMPQPPEKRSCSTPWPQWPYMLRTSSSHKEGCERRWNLSSCKFLEKDGKVCGVEVETVKWSFSPEGRPLKFEAVPDTKEIIEADLVLLAMGFTGVGDAVLVDQLTTNLTERNVFTKDLGNGVFAVGDCANGASLVVRAMADAKKVVESNF